MDEIELPAVRPFYDSRNKQLFALNDGDNLVVTQFNGTREILPCIVIDPFHTKIGDREYVPLQFEHEAEQAGTVYWPEKQSADSTYLVYEIYQTRMDRNVPYAYRSFSEARHKFKREDYVRAYASVIATPFQLHELFSKHNRDNRPFGQRMRSMSVSDVIVVKREGKARAFYVDNYGFEKISDTFLKGKGHHKEMERGEAR